MNASRTNRWEVSGSRLSNVRINSAGLDAKGWRNLALFEELSADCFNRPLLIALCERFEREARALGQYGLLSYTIAKLSLQRSVVAGTPTLESAKLYLKLRSDARRWGEPLLEAIATAKLAAAVSQAYVGAGNNLYSVEVRHAVEELLGCQIPDLTELSRFKTATFAEALCLASKGHRGSVAEAVKIINSLPTPTSQGIENGGSGVPAMNSVTRAILASAVGIANEYKIELDVGYDLFCAVLRIHPTFLAARLSAFHNRVAQCKRHNEPQAAIVSELYTHLRACLQAIPKPEPTSFWFSERDADQVRKMDVSALWAYCQERKSAPIRAYAEFALKQVDKFATRLLDAHGLAEICASYAFPEIRSTNAGAYSFLCAVENSWRAELHSPGQQPHAIA